MLGQTSNCPTERYCHTSRKSSRN